MDLPSIERLEIAAHGSAPSLEWLHLAAPGRRRGAMLLLHGAYTDAWCWAPNFMPALAAHGYDVHAVSLRGHGESGGAHGLDMAGIDDFAIDLRRALHAIGTPAVLVGASMGGYVIQRHLLDHPALAPVVLIGSVPPTGTSISHLLGMLGNPFANAGFMPGLMRGEMTASLVHLLAHDPLPESELHAFGAHTQRESMRALMELMSGLPRAKLAELAASNRTDIHMLVVAGREDRIVPSDTLHATAQVWRAEELTLAGFGHALMLEKRWQSALDAIVAWLRRSAPARRGVESSNAKSR